MPTADKRSHRTAIASAKSEGMEEDCAALHALVSLCPTRSSYPNPEYRWFVVSMGFGIVSILLHNFPYQARWLYWISVVIFCVNILLFTLFSFISIVRYTYFRGIFSAMLRHPVQSLFVGLFFSFKSDPLAQLTPLQARFQWASRQSST
jgi:Voltage-dependent anion channel